MSRGASALVVLSAAAYAAGVPCAAEELPTVASINLCTDQLVLQIADPRQIATLSWLSADPEESTLAEAAARYPLNYGSAEELLRIAPDVVVAGAYTNAFTRALLRKQGFAVIDVEPAQSLADVETNLRRIGAAIDRDARADALIDEMRTRTARYADAGAAGRPVDAVVIRPGGFTVDASSLADELMRLAGLRNLPADRGLDRWGSLSVESLLHDPPELVILTAYHTGSASLANAFLDHPGLEKLALRAVRVDVPAAVFSCGLPSSLDAVALLERAADAARDARPARDATAVSATRTAFRAAGTRGASSPRGGEDRR